MATTQEDLLKALRGSSGREQVNFDLGQVGLRPTIQQGGQYAVPVREAPRTNSALQLASALQGGSQLLSSFVDLQTKQGEIEANVLTPAEVQQKVEQGDPNATNFLDKLGKEKSFTENVYKRYFNSTVQPKLQTLQQELKSRPVHEYADMGITTPEDFQQYASGRVKELTDEFSQYTSKSPYAQALHNQLVETVVPDLVQKQVAMFDEGVTEFNKKEVITNRIPFNIENGVALDPQATTQSGTQNTFREKPRGTIYGFERKGDATFDTNSSFGIGANASAKEMAEIKAGKNNDAKLVANKDFALSPDLEEQARAAGFNLRDTMTMTMEDGSTHTGRWMDRTAKEFQGKTLSGRVDVYSPKGDSPVKDKIFVGFSRGADDAMTSFENSVSQITNINIESYKNAKYSPSEASKIAREDIVAQVKSLSTEGRFQEARKLQGVLENIKVGGQSLFGLADGKLQLVDLADSIDRAEEQESSLNARTSQDKVAKITAPAALRIMASPQDEIESVVKDEIAKLTANENKMLTPSEQVSAIEELNKQHSERLARDLNRIARTDTVVNKALENFGGKFVESNYATTNTETMSSLLVNNPDLQEFGLIADPMDVSKKTVNPAFTALTKDVKATVGSRMSLENADRISKIVSGESFTYNVGGKMVDFTGTRIPEEQKALQLKLVELYQEDLNKNLVDELKYRSASQNLTGMPTGKPMTERAKLIEKAVRENIPRDVAERELLKQETKGDVNLLKSDGTVASRPWYSSPTNWIKSGINQLTNNKALTPIQSQGIYKTIKDASNKEVKLMVPLIAKNYLGSEKELKEVDTSFRNVGLPWQSVKDGYITYQTTSYLATTAGSSTKSITDDYYAIDQYLTKAGSESEYGILPIYIMQNRETPEAKAAIEKVAKKYNKTAEALVAGQVSWYESRNINLSK
jgi:hypothetical protein